MQDGRPDAIPVDLDFTNINSTKLGIDHANAVELGVTNITDMEVLTVEPPPFYPFDLPFWPLPSSVDQPYWPTEGMQIEHGPTPLDLLNSAAYFSGTLDFKAAIAKIEKEIEQEISKAPPIIEDARTYALEEVALRKLDEINILEAKSSELLGFRPNSKSPDAIIAAYERLHGSIQGQEELFVRQMTESYAATRVRDAAVLDAYFLSAKLAQGSAESLRMRVYARREAIRVEEDRIAAEAAQAEAQLIAAEAAQAEAMKVRLANTYSASGAPVKAGVAIVTPTGLVVSTITSAAMRAAVTAAIGVVAANPVVAIGFVLGVAALVYTSRLGDGKSPERYALQLPADDLLAHRAGANSQPLRAGDAIDLPYRIGSRSNAAGDSEIFVARTDQANAPSAVRVIEAVYDAVSGLYSAVTADLPPRTLTWTPAVNPGDASTTLPGVDPELPTYPGATITPIDLRIDSFPELEDASFDDYIIVFPADSGLAPIYTMFKSRRDEPGVATGGSVASAGSWVDAAASGQGAPIPQSIADTLRGREYGSFGTFRRALWRAMHREAKLAGGVERHIFGAKAGPAPFTKESERVGSRSRYEIHHVVPIHAGGAVYDMDNLRILTPKQHINLHRKQ